jgi:hypothetical protein
MLRLVRELIDGGGLRRFGRLKEDFHVPASQAMILDNILESYISREGQTRADPDILQSRL